MLEHLLLDVGNFSEQLVYQLDRETQERLIERYYGLDDAFCREVVGKKLRKVNRTDSVICFDIIQGDPSARGLGYVDISSVSYQGYPGTELMSS